jgi:hypothetical protein
MSREAECALFAPSVPPLAPDGTPPWLPGAGFAGLGALELPPLPLAGVVLSSWWALLQASAAIPAMTATACNPYFWFAIDAAMPPPASAID